MATDFAVYGVGLSVGLPPAIANAPAFLAANLQSYGLNAAITFRRNNQRARLSVMGYGHFCAAHSLGVVLSTVIIFVMADRIGAMPAKALSVAAAFFSNYLLSARYVFKADASGAEKP